MTLSGPRVLPVDRPLTVDAKRIHKRAHGDELMAHEIGCQSGAQHLPGFTAAPFTEHDSGLHANRGSDGWELLLVHKTACIGCFGGPFDEHPDYDPKRPEEFEKLNCSIKMARFLGVDRDKALEPMLAYSLRSDRGSTRGPWDIDPIIKSWWRMGLTLQDVIALYHPIYLAWYHVFSGKPVAKPKGSFRGAIRRWMIKKFSADNDLRPVLEKLRTAKSVAEKLNLKNHRGLTQTFTLDIRTTGKSPFDLEGIWDALWAAGTDPAVIERIIETSLEAKFVEQVHFREAEDQFTAEVSYVKSNPHHPYTIAVINSDSDYINRACRKQDPDVDILIMRLSTGHIRTFNIHKRLKLDFIAGMLREAEVLLLDKKHSLPWAYLEKKGTLPEVPAWYNSHDDLGCYNSTETSPGTPGTCLSLKQVVAIYDEGLAHVWRTHRVVPVKRHNEQIAHAKKRKAGRQQAVSA